MENTNEVYKRLETLVAKRKALVHQADHLSVIEQEHKIYGYPKIHITLESHPHTFKTVNKAVAKKVFASLQKEYAEQVARKEAQIKELTAKLNIEQP